jgi:hypothetical protein
MIKAKGVERLPEAAMYKSYSEQIDESVPLCCVASRLQTAFKSSPRRLALSKTRDGKSAARSAGLISEARRM